MAQTIRPSLFEGFIDVRNRAVKIALYGTKRHMAAYFEQKSIPGI